MTRMTFPLRSGTSVAGSKDFPNMVEMGGAVRLRASCGLVRMPDEMAFRAIARSEDGYEGSRFGFEVSDCCFVSVSRRSIPGFCKYFCLDQDRS